jgi:hypothetical protein
MTQNAARTVTLDVSILGRDFKVACKEDERDELLEAVALLDRRMREIRDAGKVSGTDRIAARRQSPSTHGPRRAANRSTPKRRGVESRRCRQPSTRRSPDRKICSSLKASTPDAISRRIAFNPLRCSIRPYVL